MRKRRHAGTQKYYRNVYFRVSVLPGKGAVLPHVLVNVMNPFLAVILILIDLPLKDKLTQKF